MGDEVVIDHVARVRARDRGQLVIEHHRPDARAFPIAVDQRQHLLLRLLGGDGDRPDARRARRDGGRRHAAVERKVGEHVAAALPRRDDLDLVAAGREAANHVADHALAEGRILLAHRTVGGGDHDLRIREAGGDACLDRNLSSGRHLPRNRLEQLDLFPLQAEDDTGHVPGPVDADSTRLMSAARRISVIPGRTCAASSASPGDETPDLRTWGDGSTSP